MVKTVLPMQGVWVRSLVRELIFHMLHGLDKKIKKKKQTNKIILE